MLCYIKKIYNRNKILVAYKDGEFLVTKSELKDWDSCYSVFQFPCGYCRPLDWLVEVPSSTVAFTTKMNLMNITMEQAIAIANQRCGYMPRRFSTYTEPIFKKDGTLKAFRLVLWDNIYKGIVFQKDIPTPKTNIRNFNNFVFISECGNAYYRYSWFPLKYEVYLYWRTKNNKYIGTLLLVDSLSPTLLDCKMVNYDGVGDILIEDVLARY